MNGRSDAVGESVAADINECSDAVDESGGADTNKCSGPLDRSNESDINQCLDPVTWEFFLNELFSAMVVHMKVKIAVEILVNAINPMVVKVKAYNVHSIWEVPLQK